MARGSLRLYLGAAPGVGKTFAMLNEGRRRKDRGADVVVGYVETHGRPKTAAQIGDLEVLPRRNLEYRGAVFEEMDVDAILARKPEQVLVDELAHTNVTGSRNEKRWQDVQELLDAGIDVISTLNIQHLESVNDVVERITGVVQRETIPDALVRAADQIELVDMTPEALRRRMAHGNIYAPEKVDAALANYFRVGNLAALRELALLWVADRVEDSLQQYMADHGITEPWETRERVVVAMTGAPGAEALIRRASRMAARTRADLIGVYVRSSDGLTGEAPGDLDKHRGLLKELGGTFREVAAADPVTGLLNVVRAEHATQLVLGASHRSRLSEILRGSVINAVVRQAGNLDVHIISNRDEEQERQSLPMRRPHFSSGLSTRRQAAGWIMGVLGLPLLTLALANLRPHIALPGDLLVYLFFVVAVAAVGGGWPGLGAAVGADLLVNWFFTPPLYTFTIGETQNVIALLVFLGVAAVVSWLVGQAARRSLDAARGRAEAASLVRLAGALLTERDPLVEVMSQLQTTFSLRSVSLLRQEGSGWSTIAAAGDQRLTSPDEATDSSRLDDETVLAIAGPGLSADDRRVLRAFTDQLAVAIRNRELQTEAASAEVLGRANDLRTALLRAVSHDLRTPLASIKASATTLLADDVEWTPEATRELLKTISDEADRLNTLIGNLLDMGRLQAGALQLVPHDVAVEDVVDRAVASLGERASGVSILIDDDLPRLHIDPALLERAVANVIDNAIAYSPAGMPVRVEAAMVGSAIEVRVVDQGPGIPLRHRDAVFQPFQRFDDKRNGEGVGLGLAVARGFVDALGGDVNVDDTPGGGCTITLSLPVGQ